ncbi:MAG: hypothetical protein R6U20_04260 [Longimonas sp.]|uniref:hypothetical protein n=1 Tax=Longimonas sp. TaxID=2039626 RepID=UPI003974E1F2
MLSTARRITYLLAFGAAMLLFATGCGGDASESADTGDTDTVTLEPGERSPTIDGATARFEAPESEAVLDPGEVEVEVAVENFIPGSQTDIPRLDEIANSEDGQHTHIIVNNDPYFANYNTDAEPFSIGELEPGAYSAFVFPSRSFHESVKSEDAYDLVNFYVGEEAEGEDFPLEEGEPSIIYSRPKGTYSGDGAERIMLDFYLYNVELSEDGYRAHYTIQEEGSDETVAELTMDEWTPAFVEGLDSGTYTFTLELLDENDERVPGDFNYTEREVEVER